MKKFFYLKLLFISLCLMANTGCDNDDDDNSQNPVSELPPMTTTGENTFGCLLDGEVFIPGGGTNPLDCVYQFVDGGYYFALQGNKRNSNNNVILIGLSTNNLEINENQTYVLAGNIPANAYGSYALAGIFSETNNLQTGELTITKLDTDNQIVAGTFWFDIIDFQGNVHQIREGRFDMQYTQ